MQYRRRRNLSTRPNTTTMVLNLSLFIMLLAFFIVLNSLSTYEQIKVKPILSSLETAFSADVRQQDELPSVTPDPLQSVNEGDALDRLEALFQAQISAYEATTSKRRGIMHVKVPIERFSKAVMAIGQGELNQRNTSNAPSRFFLPTLISILKAKDRGQLYRMDIVMNIASNPAEVQNQDPESLKKTIDRMGVFVQRLENAGLPQKLISIGVKEGDEAFVELFFSKHKPFNPLGNE